MPAGLKHLASVPFISLCTTCPPIPLPPHLPTLQTLSASSLSQPHTHDFCGIGGNSEPVDRCYGGCRGGAQGLPKCTSTTPFFSGGAGTLMSCE